MYSPLPTWPMRYDRHRPLFQSRHTSDGLHPVHQRIAFTNNAERHPLVEMPNKAPNIMQCAQKAGNGFHDIAPSIELPSSSTRRLLPQSSPQVFSCNQASSRAEDGSSSARYPPVTVDAWPSFFPTAPAASPYTELLPASFGMSPAAMPSQTTLVLHPNDGHTASSSTRRVSLDDISVTRPDADAAAQESVPSLYGGASDRSTPSFSPTLHEPDSNNFSSGTVPDFHCTAIHPQTQSCFPCWPTRGVDAGTTSCFPFGDGMIPHTTGSWPSYQSVYPSFHPVPPYPSTYPAYYLQPSRPAPPVPFTPQYQNSQDELARRGTEPFRQWATPNRAASAVAPNALMLPAYQNATRDGEQSEHVPTSKSSDDPPTLLSMPVSDSEEEQDEPSRQNEKTEQSRDEKDKLLLKLKEAGYSYRDIKRIGGFTEAESTLRGRKRILTKPSHERVRRPRWTRGDVKLLREAVRKETCQSTVSTGSLARRRHWRRQHAGLNWTAIAQTVQKNGGSYNFAAGTCAKKWEQISGGDGDGP